MKSINEKSHFGTLASRLFLALAMLVLTLATAVSANGLSDSYLYDSQMGTLLNPPRTQLVESVKRAELELKDILQKLTSEDPRSRGFQWVLSIRDSSDPIAAAELVSQKSNQKQFAELKKAYGFQGNKPIALIHVTTGLIKNMQSISQLAFVIGHEVTHHLEGHTKSDQRAHSYSVIHHQSNESVADKGSMNLMRKYYDIRQASQALLKLSQYKNTFRDEERTLLSRIEQAATEDHHQIGIRLSLIEQNVLDLHLQFPNSIEVKDRPLSKNLKSMAFEPQGLMPHELILLLKKSIPGGGQNLPKVFHYLNSAEVMLDMIDKMNQDLVSPKLQGQWLYQVFLKSATWAEGVEKTLSSNFEFVSRIEKIWLSSDPSGFDAEQLSSLMSRSNEFSKIILKLAQNKLSWKNKLNEVYSKWNKKSEVSLALGMPPKRLWHEDFSQAKARYYLNILDTLTEIEFEAIRVDNLLRILKSLGDSGDRQRLVQFVDSKLLLRIENKINIKLERELQNVIDVYNKSKNHEDAYNLVYNLMKAEADGANSIDSAKWKVFVEAFDQLGLGILNILLISENMAEWKPYLKKLMTRILYDSNISDFNKIKHIVQILEITDKYQILDEIFLTDPELRLKLSQLASDPTTTIEAVLKIKNYPQAPQKFTIVSAKLRFIQLLRTTNPHFKLDTTSRGEKILNYFIEDAESTIKHFTHNGTEPRSRADGFLLQGDSARLILDWTLAIIKDRSLNNMDSYARVLRTLNTISSRHLIEPEIQKELSIIIKKVMIPLKGEARLAALERRDVQVGLGQDNLADLMAEAIEDLKIPPSGFEGKWQNLAKTFDFDKKNRELGYKVRNLIAQKLQTQPHKPNSQMTISELSETERAPQFSLLLRSWSAVVTMISEQRVQQQIEALHYFMGRTDKIPDFIIKLDQENLGQIGIKNHSASLRSQLAEQPDHFRAFFVQSILRGANESLMETKHQDLLVKTLTQNLSSDSKVVASDLIYSVIEAEGSRAPLIVSQLLASRKLNEESLLKIGLENYFVPGLKFGQYLAFTGQFKKYESILVDSQDAAPVPGYYEIMTAIYEELGDRFDFKKIQILRLLGAGTVNLALEYRDLATNEIRVLNIPRKQISERTRQDFIRFEKLTQVLSKRSRPGYNYDFVRGLVRLIKSSIQLEFDRKSVFKRQNEAFEIYDGKRLGTWKFQSVSAFELVGDAIFMSKAPGKTAKKILQENPALYKEVMKGVYKFERDQIFQVLSGESKNLRLANPDLHDGQVLIDEKNKIVTVIDFGQALPITQKQIDFGLRLVSGLVNIQSPDSFLSYLNSWLINSNSKESISAQELKEILSNEDMMDRFIRLISKLELMKAPLPLEVVHLVFQLNRVIKLGEKVGAYPKMYVGVQLMMRELQAKISGKVNSCRRSVEIN